VVPEPTATALGAAVVAWGLLLAVVTFARWPALSWSVGATCLGTVYQAVNAVPTVLFDLAAGGALASVSIPMLVGAVGHGRPRDVARLGSAVLTWTVVVLGACSVAVGLAASPLAGVLVGESGCTGAVDVAADLLRWFAPQPVLLGAGVVLGGILRAHGRPLAAVVGPALGSLVVVGSLVWFHQLAAVSDATGVPEGHLAVLAGGTTLAALVVAAVPAVLLWRTGVALRPAVRAPVALAAETRGVAQALVLTALGLVFATVVAVVVTFRSGVGVLPVLAYLQGVLLVPYAALLLPVVTDALPRLAGAPTAPAAPATPATPATPEVPGGPEAHVEPEAQADPEATTVLTRSARHRQAPSVGALAGRARAATALGAVAASAVAAAAIPVGGFFTALDAARETTQGRAALDALAPGLWAGAPSLLLLGLVGVLCAALYVRGRPFVAGGAVAAACLIAGAVPLVAVMPGATPTWALVILGVAPVVGLTLATLDLLAATSRAWGPGALAGLGRTLSVGVLAAAAGAAAGILVGRWWLVEGPWANAGVAVALAVLGAAVTGGVLVVADRVTAGQLWGALRPNGQGAE